MNALEIRNLRTHIRTPEGLARAVDGVDLTLGQGEAVGLVGESGSGKSVLGLSILGLLPVRQASILPGSSIRLRGEELVDMDSRRLRQIRGGEIGMVFQEPSTSLNPVFTIGHQLLEVLELHGSVSGRAARHEAIRLMEEVDLPDPARRLRSYPHQLSGGMRQRAMIAMALAGSPKVLIADEPTTALDVTVQSQILRLLERIQRELGMALLLISHDLGVVSRICRRIVVMYGGRIVEAGDTREVLERPRHPYTRGLLGSRLSLTDRRRTLRPIPGDVPDATDWPRACRFHPRCPEAYTRCRKKEPELFDLTGSGTNPGSSTKPGPPGGHPGGSVGESGEGRRVRCWLVEPEAS